MNKYKRHLGIIEFSVGGDTFKMRPNIDDWVKLFGTVEGKSKDDLASMTKEDLVGMVDVITGAIHRCDPEESVEDVKGFVEANLMVCMNAFTKLMGKDEGMKDLVKKRMDQLGKNNDTTIKG